MEEEEELERESRRLREKDLQFRLDPKKSWMKSAVVLSPPKESWDLESSTSILKISWRTPILWRMAVKLGWRPRAESLVMKS